MDLDVSIPYLKHGDMFHTCLEQTNRNPSEAFRLWATALKDYANDLEQMADLLKGQDIQANGDTHCLSLFDVNTELAKKLIAAGYCSEDESCDEEDE